jgi:hypothetical protein
MVAESEESVGRQDEPEAAPEWLADQEAVEPPDAGYEASVLSALELPSSYGDEAELGEPEDGFVPRKPAGRAHGIHRGGQPGRSVATAGSDS